jgi:hypothetical protein
MKTLTKKQREKMLTEEFETAVAIQKQVEKQEQAELERREGEPTGIFREVKASILHGIYEDSHGQNSILTENRA